MVLCDNRYATNLASSECLHFMPCTATGAQGCLPSWSCRVLLCLALSKGAPVQLLP